MKKIIIQSLVFLILAFSVAGVIPKLTSHVTDNAGILSLSAISQLEEQLKMLEKETNGVQYVVLIEKEYPKEYSLEEYTLKIAETNKIGKKGNDNGILLYVAVDDKQFRWEVGYGVESTLNSALLGRISRDYIIPNFRKGDYEEGILQAVDVTKRLLLGSNDPDIIKIVQGSSFNPSTITKVIFLIILIIIGVMILIYASQTSRKKIGSFNDSYYSTAAGGIFIGGFGSGGFGGSGGSGGFSGGGGTFGGGGFSGRF